MKRCCGVWSTIAANACEYQGVDVAQLTTHAFAIRTQRTTRCS